MSSTKTSTEDPLDTPVSVMEAARVCRLNLDSFSRMLSRGYLRPLRRPDQVITPRALLCLLPRAFHTQSSARGTQLTTRLKTMFQQVVALEDRVSYLETSLFGKPRQLTDLELREVVEKTRELRTRIRVKKHLSKLSMIEVLWWLDNVLPNLTQGALTRLIQLAGDTHIVVDLGWVAGLLHHRVLIATRQSGGHPNLDLLLLRTQEGIGSYRTARRELVAQRRIHEARTFGGLAREESIGTGVLNLEAFVRRRLGVPPAR